MSRRPFFGPRDGVITCRSNIEVPAEVVAGILRADADDTTGRIATKEGALRPFEDFDLVDAIELGQRTIQAQDVDAIHISGDRVFGDRKSTTSELQSLMRISYAVFCLKKKK